MFFQRLIAPRYATAALPMILSCAAGAQATSGTLSGVVTDASGAAVAGAQITAVNTVSGASAAGQPSNERGEYRLLNLPPGTYTLRLAAPGYAGYEQKGIRLDLQQNAEQNVVLAAGAVSQEVRVQANVSDLDTTSSTNSTEVTGESIRNLPLNTRESYSLLTLVPGFSGSIGNDYNNVSYSIDGGDNQYGDILVDGTPAGFPTVNGFQGVGVNPSVDAIGEFRLLAQTFPAEFGRSLDGVLNVVYKTGTNQFHGTAFEFLRNSYFDANDFFSNRNGVALPLFHRNQFGGVLDGPIRRSKTFFLLSTELLKQNAFQSLLTTVPTLLQRQGDFSQTFAPDGSLVRIYDPFTTRPAAGGYARDAFAGNVLPAGRQSRVGQNILAYYPLPNVPGNTLTGANNYFANGSVSSETIAWDARIDHAISDRHKVFARYSNRYYESRPNPLFPAAQAVAEGLINSNDTSRGVTVGYTATLSPRVLWDTRLGFARTLYNYGNTSMGFDDTTLALPASINAAAGTPLFPAVNANGYTTLGNPGNRHNAFMTYSLLSSVTVERGEHVFKAGFDGRIIRVNDNESSDTSGNFTFNRNFTEGPDPNAAAANSGNGLASLLLGTGTGDVIQDFKNVATQSFYFAGYLQDDWHALRRLTLNLGLRYDIDTPRTERYNRMNYFDPNAPSPLAVARPGLEGGLRFVGVDGRSRYQYNVDKNNLAPRVGFAYAATQNTAVHGGAGVVYGASNQAAAGTVGPYGFRVQNTWVSSLDGITPLNTLDNPFPQGFEPPPGASGGLATGAGGQIEGVLQRSPSPYVMEWNLDVQQSLPHEITFDLAYVGNRGRQQLQSGEGGLDFDQLPTADLALGSALNDSVPNPFYGVITSNTLAAPTTTRAQLLLAYPQYTSFLPLRVSGGDSQYDSFQASVRKRLGAGLQLQANYVWARDFDNGTTHQDSFRPKADYAISAQDIRHRFVASYIYQLPFGRGRRFGANLGKLEDELLGGWQANGITTVQSGTPLPVTGSNTLAQFNFQTLYANWTGRQAALGGRVEDRLDHYFDTAQFAQPAPFTLGSGPAYYDNLRGPGLNSTDFSVFKQFALAEQANLEFRAEAFNVLNQVSFGAPDTGVTDANFGVITSQANTPRQLQFALKLLF